MRILVADDEPLVLDLIVMILKSAGHAVQGVRDGREALSLLELKTFDVVITDLSMPNLDGLALAREIKSANRGVRVVLLTGHGTGGGKPPHVDYLLAKPLRMEALTSLIQSLEQPISILNETASPVN